MPTYEGRLELTWTNKHLRLLADEHGSYEWLEPSDYRVAEVRLLADVERYGSTNPTRAQNNLLVEGDSLYGLTALSRLPEFSQHYLNQVRLAYLDPPFNTGQAFEHYDDALEHSVWLTMMRDRLVQIRDLLSADGSVWVHCDDSEQAYLKAVMDELFGRQNFVGTFVWQKTLTRRNDARLMSNAHDYLVVFGKDLSKTRFNRVAASEKQRATYSNRDNDPRGDWLAVPFHAPNVRANLSYPIVTPGGRTLLPPAGRCWSTTEERLEELRADNRIYFGKDGNGMAQRKKFWNENETGMVPWSWWPYEEYGENREANKESKAIASLGGLTEKPFATPKPERLLRQIIEIASDPQDLVLDCFAGSATTAAVAHKMGRRWLAVERERETLDSFALPRLRAVVDGRDPGGVTEEQHWEGGGGFNTLRIAPSMFEVDEGLVFLSEKMTNGALAEATAAQLGFQYAAEPPFSGIKGRTRLAVIDGVVNEDVVRLLASALGEREQIVVCGTGIDQESRTLLRSLRPGSTLRKVPAALLSSYRHQVMVSQTEGASA